MNCPHCHKPLVEVDNPIRREVRHRRGEKSQCPGPTAPVVVRGVLGWGNRKGGYEAYGPGGRWANGTTPEHGDLLGDALEHAGASEGATLLIIAVERFGDLSILDRLEALIPDQVDPS